VLNEAEISCAANDDMVKKGDTKDFRGLTKTISDVAVLRGWVKTPRGMIMRYNYSACVLNDGRIENLARMNNRAIHESDRNYVGFDDLMGAVQGQAQKFFRTRVRITLKNGIDVLRAINLIGRGMAL
jgi:hypothetical protein